MQISIRPITRRLAQILPVIVLATFVVFGLLQLVPGDIAIALAGESASAERIAELRALYGLDRPFLLQYGHWLLNAVQGDLSRSFLSGVQVTEAIFQRLPNTLLIVVLAQFLALLIGMPLGIAAARRAGSVADTAVSTVSALGVALPNFWLAMILVSIVAMDLRLLPATGAAPLLDDPIAALRHALLPAIALASSGISEVARQLRGTLVEFLSSQAVRTLRAKGLSPTAILWRHGLKNVGVTLLTVGGLLFNRMLGATVVIEAVFAIPGIGSLMVQSAVSKDFPVVQGVVLVLVVMVILINLTIDILYGLIDPRMRQR